MKYEAKVTSLTAIIAVHHFTYGIVIVKVTRTAYIICDKLTFLVLALNEKANLLPFI